MSKWPQLISDAQKVALFGARLRIGTPAETFEGLLHYNDDTFLILKNDQEYYLVNHSQITEYTPLGVQDPKVTLESLMSMDLRAKAEEIITQSVKDPRTLLFDHLIKLYKDTEWQQNDIVIPAIQIRISAPYQSENIKGDNQRAVERLKKIIDKYWKA